MIVATVDVVPVCDPVGCTGHVCCTRLVLLVTVVRANGQVVEGGGEGAFPVCCVWRTAVEALYFHKEPAADWNTLVKKEHLLFQSFPNRYDIYYLL